MKPSSTSSPYSYPFPPRAPNPPLYFHSLPQPPPAAAAPVPDLSASLSSLTHLLSLSHQTLSSLSSLLPSADPPNSHFVSCLHDPHHLLPPESLFIHSLRCPFPLLEDLKSLVDSLYYRRTLTPSGNPPIQDSGGELCVSLDCYFKEFASNFFYQDCPGVVNFCRFDNANRSFILPGVLSVECANVGAGSEGNTEGFDEHEFIILPSDLWAIRREIEGWVDYPSVYSYATFCAILNLNSLKWSDLSMWIISSSPRYGIVIDVYMRDHIAVLFCLCLKAIRKEAIGLLCHKKSISFHCPVLGQVLKWIASQLSILYGEVNATFFVMHMFNKCVLEAANHVLLPLESSLEDEAKELDENKNELRDVKLNEDSKTSTGCKVGLEADERVDKKVIFISQVAASIAALHERSLLEAKIRKMREFQHVPRYQRMLEHDYISKRAEELRDTRPDFRAIIDHDGLPRKPSNNQETGKLKTREELLAEERDYKRRRMSYRGKKLKRTPLQVMRDIIDEYTEEIKQAGGIGCFEKGNEEEEISRIATSRSDVTGDQMLGTIHQKQLQSDSTSKDAPTQDYNQQGLGHHRNYLEYQRSSGQDRRARDEYSRSPERHRSYGSYHDRRSYHRKHDAELIDAKRHERRSSSKSDYRSDKSSYSEKRSENSNGRHRDRRHRHENQNDGFDDRYDPAESCEIYGDDVDAVSD